MSQSCASQDGKCPNWRVLNWISQNLCILCRNQGACAQYVPLHIYSFPLRAPGKPPSGEGILCPDLWHFRPQSAGRENRTKGDQQKVLGGVFHGKGIGKAGNRRTIRLFPASALCGFHDCIQKASFCRVGQFRPLSRWVTVAAWTSATRFASASFPPSVVGAYTIREKGAICRITVTSRMPECHERENAGAAFYSLPGSYMNRTAITRRGSAIVHTLFPEKKQSVFVRHPFP